jgi:O-antigen ligase/tetratricopeptide (TPR) repeat protein
MYCRGKQLVHNLIFIVFISVLFFSPLAFGTVEPWSLAIMETLSLLLLLFVLIGGARSKQAFYQIPGIVPLMLFLTYVFIQLIPLPPWMIKVISPATYAIYSQTVLVSDPAAWVSLSINKKATLMEFFRFASYGAFYAATVQLLSSKDALKKTITIIIVFASSLSFFSILQHLLSNGKLYWFRELQLGGVPFGPYVNRNHYAGLMEMLFPLVVGLFLVYKPHVSYISFREKIVEIFNLQRTNLYMLLGFSAVLIGTSIFLSLSRSGIISLCLSMIVFGLLVVGKQADRKRGVIIIVICILIVLAVGWFGWGPIIERFKEISPMKEEITEFRPILWKDSRKIADDFPVTGTGFGSFVTIYPLYRTLPARGLVDHAHNDYLELLTDGGIIGFLIVAWFVLTVFYTSFRVFLKRRELYSVYLFIGSIAGLVSILLHSVTDFNLHTGANGLYFFLLSGLMVSTANTRLREGLNGTYLRQIHLPSGTWAVITGVVLLICAGFNAGVIAGRMSFFPLQEKKLSRDISGQALLLTRERTYRASHFDPLESRYHYSLAYVERLLANQAAARDQYKKAVYLNPLNSEYLQRFGLLLSETKNYPAAERLLRSGITYDPGNHARYRTYALWLLSQGRKQDAAGIITTAISLKPEKTRDYITLLLLNGFSDDEITNSLPERVEPFLYFAQYLTGTGRAFMVENAYLSALQNVKNESTVKPSFFSAIYWYYMSKGRYDDALQVMRSATEYLPNDVGIRFMTGFVYEKMGIPYRAIEEYRKALMIDPKRQDARKRLDALLVQNK